jgi:hypothetical protein
MRAMKPIIIGLHNPYSTVPKDALLPYPDGSAGHRLWKMFSVDGPRFQNKEAYAKAFDRRNLSYGLLSDRKMQRHRDSKNALAMLATLPQGSTVFLLGKEVLDAFSPHLSRSLYPILIHPQVIDGITWRWLPHPSGRVTQYNDPVLRILVGMALAEVLRTQESLNASQ